MKLSDFKPAEPLEIIYEYLMCFNYVIALSHVEMALVRIVKYSCYKCIPCLMCSEIFWSYLVFLKQLNVKIDKSCYIIYCISKYKKYTLAALFLTKTPAADRYSGQNTMSWVVKSLLRNDILVLWLKYLWCCKFAVFCWV